MNKFLIAIVAPVVAWTAAMAMSWRLDLIVCNCAIENDNAMIDEVLLGFNMSSKPKMKSQMLILSSLCATCRRFLQAIPG